ncbi:PerC family transcriptional regulator [Enterobacter ludwigii]|uniref:PerC family transcriptional regulator n=1 Tax=Enterobacter ludwigii TaxID=299767 RepID=UPI0009234C05|nr:PerC family transcriptional regulator [Enterobacter ludwigii]SHL80234.1 PerC transcriptional activator [Enterobacter ludwigii]
MTKALTQKEKVAVFVRYQPNCTVGDVSEALDLAGGTAGRLLRELSDEGVIIRSRDSVQYTYRALPHADIPDVIIPCMVEKSDPVRMQTAEQKAKALEDKGLWRRAAAVYSEMFGIAGSAVEVSRIAKRRKDCLHQARRA